MEPIVCELQLYTNLSLRKLALAKQSKLEFMRSVNSPGVLTAMGY